MNIFLNAACLAFVHASTFQAKQAYIVDGNNMKMKKTLRVKNPQQMFSKTC